MSRLAQGGRQAITDLSGFRPAGGMEPEPSILGPDGKPLLALDQYDKGMVLSHIFTFTSLLRGAAQVYFREKFDEAMRHSRENALACRLDDHIQACLNERIRATTSLRWHIEAPNVKDPWQKGAAAGVEQIIRSIHRLRRLMKQSMQAVWYGRYGNELQWIRKPMKLPSPNAMQQDQEDTVNALTVSRHLPINGDKIGYTWDHRPTIRIYTAHANDFPKEDTCLDNLGYSLILGPKYRDRFLIHTYSPDDADFYDPLAADAVHGLGIRSWLYWSWWTKTEFMTSIVDALERFGLGIVTIKFDQSNDQARQQAEKIAKDYSRRSILLIPCDTETLKSGNAVEVIEAPTAGMTVLLELQRACEKRQERFIIAQTLSSDHRGSGGLGGGGVADFQRETKWDVIEEDSCELAETLTGNDMEPGLVNTILKWTYPWADFPLRLCFDTEPNQALQKMTLFQMGWGMGARVGESRVQELMGTPMPSPDEPVLQNPQIAMAQLQLEMAQQQMAAGQMPGAEGESEQGPEDEAFDQLMRTPEEQNEAENYRLMDELGGEEGQQFGIDVEAMHYALGDVARGVGRAIGSGAKAVGQAIGSELSGRGPEIASAVRSIPKIPGQVAASVREAGQEFMTHAPLGIPKALRAAGRLFMKAAKSPTVPLNRTAAKLDLNNMAGHLKTTTNPAEIADLLHSGQIPWHTAPVAARADMIKHLAGLPFQHKADILRNVLSQMNPNAPHADAVRRMLMSLAGTRQTVVLPIQRGGNTPPQATPVKP